MGSGFFARESGPPQWSIKKAGVKLPGKDAAAGVKAAFEAKRVAEIRQGAKVKTQAEGYRPPPPKAAGDDTDAYIKALSLVHMQRLLAKSQGRK